MVNMTEKQQKIKIIRDHLWRIANRKYWEDLLHVNEPLKISQTYMTQECF